MLFKDNMEQVKRKNLDYIDYFRAIAIIFIVTGHTLVWGRSTMLEFNTLLFAGGNYFFVFIAKKKCNLLAQFIYCAFWNNSCAFA